ncbi:MAG TPA: NAD(P)-dependent oxidoreductase [Myxococcota bacterium]|nr:NAD(P)-dependent oxidoreductase [Myxococcota bacterium]
MSAGNQIVAIDLAQRIPEFAAQAGLLSSEPLIQVATAEEAKTLVFDKKLVSGILVSIYQPLSAGLLSKFPELRFICVLGTSTKLLPMDYCNSHGIRVLTVTEYCDMETAEWVMLQVMKFFRYQKPAVSVFERPFGIIGMGAVGKRLLAMAQAFGMSVHYHSQRVLPELSDLGAARMTKEEIFSSCDVVSFHTSAHVPFLTIDMLSHAKPNLCLINTCMGRISHGLELEEFLNRRPDVTLIMDKIAGASYASLSDRAQIAEESAFFTIDSERRLINKFLANLEYCARYIA